MKYLAILCLLAGAPSWAADAKYLREGEKAPFSGYLIDDEQAEKVRNLKIDLGTLEKVNVSMGTENEIMVRRLNNSNAHIDSLAKQLVDSRDEGFFTKAAYFMGGAVITGVIAYGAARAVR